MCTCTRARIELRALAKLRQRKPWNGEPLALKPPQNQESSVGRTGAVKLAFPEYGDRLVQAGERGITNASAIVVPIPVPKECTSTR